MIKNLFDECTAWFSSSIPAKIKELWHDHGGQIGTLEAAEYVFSEDAECEDTLKIFESESFLNECLSVFHPSYIVACVKYGSREDVDIGRYFFPPTDIQEMMKAWNMEHDWESAEYQVAPKSATKKTRQPRQKQDQGKSLQNVRKSPRFHHDIKVSSTTSSSEHETTNNNNIDRMATMDLNRKTETLRSTSKEIVPPQRNNKRRQRPAIVEDRGGLSSRSESKQSNNNDAVISSTVRDEEDVEIVKTFDNREVLRLQDLQTVSGKLQIFQVTDNDCEFVYLETQ